MSIGSDFSRLHDRIAGYLVMILRQIAAESDRNEVQHDRVDNFMRSKLRFQDAGNATPDRTSADRGDETERQQQGNWKIGNRGADDFTT